MLSPWGRGKEGVLLALPSILRAVERLQTVEGYLGTPDSPKRIHGQKIGLGGQQGRTDRDGTLWKIPMFDNVHSGKFFQVILK
jgi:hypothetical protein